MGLTIYYELQLPGTMSEDAALSRLELLRAYSSTLDISNTSPLMSISTLRLSVDSRDIGRESDDWWLHMVANSAREERDGADPCLPLPDRLAAAVFIMNPGEECESAAFGLVRPLLTEPPTGVERKNEWRNWFWQSWCKTQYASMISEEHFVHCHLSVVRMLEEAQRIGFEVTVCDETNYWETRSIEGLLVEVRNMNRLVARFAGKLSDALGPEVSIQAPIFESREFEHLEMEQRE